MFRRESPGDTKEQTTNWNRIGVVVFVIHVVFLIHEVVSRVVLLVSLPSEGMSDEEKAQAEEMAVTKEEMNEGEGTQSAQEQGYNKEGFFGKMRGHLQKAGAYVIDLAGKSSDNKSTGKFKKTTVVDYEVESDGGSIWESVVFLSLHDLVLLSDKGFLIDETTSHN